MKRLFCLLVCLCLVLSGTAFARSETGYVTNWDLTQIYADQAAFDADYAAAEALIARYEELRGTISTPAGMLALLQLNVELSKIKNRLYCYASFQTTLDISDANAMTLSARVDALMSSASQASSFTESELGAMTPEARAALADAPELAEFAHNLEYLKDENTVYYSEETNTVLATLGDALNGTDDVYQTLLYGDLPYPVYVTDEGEEITLDPATFQGYVYGGAPRETLIAMSELRATRYKPFANTFAVCLDKHIRTTWDVAQLNHYDSTLEYALDSADVDPAVYDMLLKMAHDGAADSRRYYEAMKRALGLADQEMYGFDTYLPPTDYAPEKTYEQSADDVAAALSIFGDEYAQIVNEMLTTGHIDAFPGANKDTGAYSSEVDGEILPYITMNYISANDASTLAHELGHSLYNYLSASNQPAQYASPNIFTHEVTSTTNEIIYYRTMYDAAQSDDERLYYLQKQIDLFDGTFFTQMLFAEFEDYCYKTVEAGGTLVAADLSAEYLKLDEQYYGDTIHSFDGTETGWCAIPHFYYDYYVYNYASAVCYASAVANRIYDGEEGAKENYLAFLKLGASVSPMEALKVAGVDPLAQQTYDDALAYFQTLIDQYEALIAA